MSPLSLRRHRAERLLREQFEGLRGSVLANVRGRLRGRGVSLDQDDLEACYAVAWQGLYMAVLEGQEIASPAGWLTVVTFRRAIDEHRARVHARCGSEPWMHGPIESFGEDPGRCEAVGGTQRDLAAELDDRARLCELLEGLRGRLNGREREAATLCYLQGLSRSQAAARMGMSEARMRKLMEGRGPGRPGVAGKVGALVETIRAGGWCEEQGSLMCAFAYGILDPEGERYRLALAHTRRCSACRAYVASLRGLAAALPPVCLPWGVGAAVLARAGDGAHAGGFASGGTAASLQAGRGVGGALSASGAAGAGGAAGGGWLVGAGPLGAKLAAGCLLALGVGAGCVALDGVTAHGRAPAHARLAARGASTASVRAPSAGAPAQGLTIAPHGAGVGSASAPATSVLTPAGRVSREFGPEQALARGSAASVGSESRQAPSAHSASSGSAQRALIPSAVAGSSSGAWTPSRAAPQSGAGDSAAAEREFSPG